MLYALYGGHQYYLIKVLSQNKAVQGKYDLLWLTEGEIGLHSTWRLAIGTEKVVLPVCLSRAWGVFGNCLL